MKINSLRTLKTILSKYKYQYVMANLFLVLNIVMIGFLPNLTNNIFDYAISLKNLELLLNLSLLFIAIYILSSVFEMLSSNKFAKIGASISNDLRALLLRSVSKKSGKFFTKLKSGDLSARVLSEVEFIEVFITQNLFAILLDILSTLVLATILFTINFQLMLIILLFQPIIILVQNRFGQKAAGQTKKLRKSYQELSVHTNEFFLNIMNMIFIHSMDFFFNRYSKSQEDVINDVVKSQKIGNKSYFCQGVLSNLILVIIIGVGGFKVINEEMTLGQLVTFNLYINRIIGSINRIAKSNIRVRQFFIYVERIFEVINDDAYLTINKPTMRMNNLKKSIVFKNVNFSYDDKIVLCDCNIVIKKGQRIAIVGESGMGKSTIINLLFRLWNCDSGEILFDGIDIKRYDLETYRKSIGIVSQNTMFFNDTIYNNLVLGQKIDMDFLRDVCMKVHIYDFIMKCPNQFETIIDENGKNLSGGEKQRLALARVLLMNADILVLDEPTSSIDTILESDIKNNLEQLSLNKTMITITHNLEIIKDYDIIYVIDKGKVVEKGNHKELMVRHNKYFQLFVG